MRRWLLHAERAGLRRGLWPAVALLCLLAVAPARLSAAEEDNALLRRGAEAAAAWRVAEARACADELLRRLPGDPACHALAAEVALMEGRYAECRRSLEEVRRLGTEPPEELAQMMAGLQAVHEAFREQQTGRFLIRWANPADAVLCVYAPEALEKALDTVERELNYRTQGPVLVEIYPDLESFSAASTLTRREIETTGVVAICKFNRVMIASPRLYVQGYPWCDTLAHELTHYVIIQKTGNGVPVWLHEGIAKYCETLWRRPPEQVALSALQQTLLAEARETGHYITFEQMHPSVAMLDSQQDAALAFAEVDGFVQWLRARSGPRVLGGLLDRVQAGEDLGQAFRQAAGQPPERLHAEWLDHVKGMELKRVPGLRLMPRRAAQGRDNTESEPALSGELPEEVRRFARLGDMLRDEGRSDAAALEYGKAVQGAAGPPPHLAVRLARAQLESGAREEALKTLDGVAACFEDYLPQYEARGEVYAAMGLRDRAVQAQIEAVRINPFDPRPHQELMELYTEGGLTQERDRERRVLDILAEWLRS